MWSSEVIRLARSLQGCIECCTTCKDVTGCCNVIRCVSSVSNIRPDLAYCSDVDGKSPPLKFILFLYQAVDTLLRCKHVPLEHGYNLYRGHQDLNLSDEGHRQPPSLGNSGPSFILICLCRVYSRELVTSIGYKCLSCFSLIIFNSI